MKVILENDYHQTTAVVYAKGGVISARAMRAARKKLCGMSDCSCGDIRPMDNRIDFQEDGSAILYCD